MTSVRRLASPAAIVLSLLVYLAWQIIHRGVYTYATSIYSISDADEWRYTACSRLVAHGYRLFDQVFSAQPPVLFLSLSAGMRIFGESIGGARPVEIVSGAVALLSAAAVAYLLAGRVASVATAVVLTLSPLFLVYSHMIEAEMPMTALETAALALLLLSARAGSRRWLPVAGVLLAAAILTKLFAVEALLPALVLIALNGRTRARRVRDVWIFLGAVSVPVVLDFALVSPAAQWGQVIGMHTSVGALPNLTPPARVMTSFFGLDLGLTLLAAAGLASLVLLRRWTDLAFLASWLLGTAVMLALFRPLFPHHPVILLTALGVSAGVAVQQAWELAPSMGRTAAAGWRRPITGRSRRAACALSSLAILAWAALLPRIVHDDRHLLLAGPPPAGSPLVLWIDAHSSPRDFVAADDLRVADSAGRLVPPPLCDPSNVRLYAGYLTRHDLIDATTRYRPKLVVASLGIYQQVKGYTAWLAGHGYRRTPAPGATETFTRK